MITLVRADQGDLDSVMQVMAAAFDKRYGEAWTRSQCAGILPMQGVKLVIAEDEEKSEILGFSLYRTIASDSELLLLAVLPDRQRRGIGRRLLNHFIDDSKKSGAKTIHLEVRDGNPAIRLYESIGFAAAGRRKNYYRGTDGTNRDALTFALNVCI